jgi:hypothetical protein
MDAKAGATASLSPSSRSPRDISVVRSRRATDQVVRIYNVIFTALVADATFRAMENAPTRLFLFPVNHKVRSLRSHE